MDTEQRDPFGVLQIVSSHAPHVVVLDRIADVTKPDYCIRGKATCVYCDHWCWLGVESLRTIKRGSAVPMCLPCGQSYLTPASRVGNVCDPPHDH